MNPERPRTFRTDYGMDGPHRPRHPRHVNRTTLRDLVLWALLVGLLSFVIGALRAKGLL